MDLHALFWNIGSLSTFAIGLVYIFVAPASPEVHAFMFRFKPIPETKLLLGLAGVAFLSVAGIFCVVASAQDPVFRAKVNKSGVIGTLMLLAFIGYDALYVHLYTPLWSRLIMGMLGAFLALGFANIASGGGGGKARPSRAKKAA